MTLKGHFGIIYDLCWSNNNKNVISTSADGSVRIWSLEKQEVITSAFHASFVYAAQIEPIDNSLLITGGYDRLIRIWSITLSANQDNSLESGSSKLLQELSSHKAYVNAICFHPSGKTFYSGDGDGSVMVWMLDAGGNQAAPATYMKEIQVDGIKGCPITSLDMHPIGHRLLVQSHNNKLQIVDLRVEASVHKLLGPVNIQSKLRSCFSADGSLVFSGSEDGRVYVWSTESGNQLAIYADLSLSITVCGLDSHPFDDYVAFCCHDYNHPIKIYKYDSSSPVDQSLPREVWRTPLELNAMMSHENMADIITTAKSSLEDFDFVHAMRLQNIKSKLYEVNSMMQPPSSSNQINMFASKTSNQYYPSSISTLSAVTQRPSTQPLLTIAAVDDQEIRVVFKPSASARLNEIMIATKEYNAQRSDELTFSKGDSIVVLHKDNQSWWMGYMPSTMKQGFFPANHVLPKSKSTANQSRMEVNTSDVSKENEDVEKKESKHGNILREKSHRSRRNSERRSSGSKNRVSFNLENEIDLKKDEGLSSITNHSSTDQRRSTNLNYIPEDESLNIKKGEGILLNHATQSRNEVISDNVCTKPPLPGLMHLNRRTSQLRALPSATG